MPMILHVEQDRKLPLPPLPGLLGKVDRWHRVKAQLPRTNVARIEASMARGWVGDGCVRGGLLLVRWSDAD